MPAIKTPSSNIKFYFFGLLAFLIWQTPSAMSRMGTAEIINSEGVPCFSVPKNIETSKGLPLHGIFVSELPDGKSTQLPPYVWSIRTTNYESPPNISPAKCIRYGEYPDGTDQYILKPLEIRKVYSVFIKAVHNDSSMIGYTGKFCIKPIGSGRTFVQVISDDPRLGIARFAGCTK